MTDSSNPQDAVEYLLAHGQSALKATVIAGAYAAPEDKPHWQGEGKALIKALKAVGFKHDELLKNWLDSTIRDSFRS